ncbi:sugar ABC transporter ATP-binding protein [Planctomycetota bacterium]|nr:sugar ABC transporter ATP-binding protein [Planctomycetota bacterium]
MLRCSGLRKAFGATQALAGVDLAVEAGQVLALVGENGAGKSTLIKVLTGAHACDAGTMLLAGRPYAPTGPVDARNLGVAVVYQELTICRHLTVAENIVLGACPQRFGVIDRQRRDAMASAALAQLGIDLPLVARCGSLSVAQQQLVEIARALATTAEPNAEPASASPAPPAPSPRLQAPRLLILDEPTSSLTAADVGRLLAVIRRVAAAGAAVVFISHALEECREIAEQVCVLRDGASVLRGNLAEIDDAAMIRAMVGRSVDDLYPRPPRAAGSVALRCVQVAGEVLPRDASLEVRHGEVVGLYGLVGSGRTELLRVLFGLDRAVAGQVELEPKTEHPVVAASPITTPSPQTRLAQGMALLSEDRKAEGLCLGRSLADNLLLTRPGPACWNGSSWLPWLPTAARRIANGWIARFAIKARHGDQAVQELSGGNQQKVALARILHHGARILLLDEPTRGVDVAAKAAIYQVIGEQAAAGKAVVVVSSYLPELLGICDRIAVMRRGVLGAARPVAAWQPADLLAEALG